MKVLIDATVLADQFRFRGVGKLAFSLIRELIKDQSIEWYLLAPGNKHDMAVALGFDEHGELSHDFEFVSLGKKPGMLRKVFTKAYFKLQVEPKINQVNPDVFISLNVENGIPNKIKTLAFVHDVTPLKSGVYSQKNPLANSIKKYNYNWALDRVKRADRVITISEFTKSDLISVGFDSGKIEVMSLALSDMFVKEIESLGKDLDQDERLKRRVLNIYNITEPYISYVGGMEANKNVEQILRCFAAITDKHPGLKLVIGGNEFKLGWDHKAVPQNERAQKIHNLAKELKILHSIVFTGFIEEQHLPVILKFARCFVHLSKYEGFGLAVLEPQLVGTPVVASNLTSYPEVLKDSALLVDPDNTEEVTSALHKLLGHDDESEKLRAKLIKAGKKNVARFSWKKSAAKVINIAKEEIAKSGSVKLSPTKSMVKQSKDVEKPVPSSYKGKKAVVLAPYFHPFVGGMEQVALDYAKFLIRLGFDVTVVTSDRKNGQIVIKKDDEYKFEEGVIKIRRLKRQGKNYYIYRLVGLSRELRKLKPDLIHSHSFGFLYHDFAMWMYKRFANHKARIISTPHGPFMSKPEKGIRSMIKIFTNIIQSLYLNRLLDAVIQVNPEQHKWMKNMYGIPENKVHFMTPLMPQPKLSFNKLKSIKQKKDFIQLTSLGRLAGYKGYDDIITAFNEINTATPTKLVIAGKSDNFEKKIADLMAGSPRHDDIKLEKDVTDDRRDEILQKTDIFIFASQWEAFGIVIAEAMSHGCAILSTDTEGGKFLVKPGGNGYLFEYKDMRKLVEHINKLINDKKELVKMQENAYNSVGEYSAESMFERYKKLVSKLNLI